MVRLFRTSNTGVSCSPHWCCWPTRNGQNLLADTTWPSEDVPFTRGPGGYLSLPKLLFCWLLFLLWVRTVDWVNQDVQQNRQSYASLREFGRFL